MTHIKEQSLYQKFTFYTYLTIIIKYGVDYQICSQKIFFFWKWMNPLKWRFCNELSWFNNSCGTTSRCKITIPLNGDLWFLLTYRSPSMHLDWYCLYQSFRERGRRERKGLPTNICVPAISKYPDRLIDN